jgi:hypothetical protein
LTLALAAAHGTRRPTIVQREAIMTALGYGPWPEQADFHFDIDPATGEEPQGRHRWRAGRQVLLRSDGDDDQAVLGQDSLDRRPGLRSVQERVQLPPAVARTLVQVICLCLASTL